MTSLADLDNQPQDDDTQQVIDSVLQETETTSTSATSTSTNATTNTSSTSATNASTIYGKTS